MQRESIVMSKNDQFNYRVLEDFRSGHISRQQAAVLMGCTERAVSRRVKKLRDHGMAGVKHGNNGRMPVNKLSQERKLQLVELIKSTYYDLNMQHLREMLKEKHDIEISYTSLRRLCHMLGAVKRQKKIRSSRQRIYRERMRSEGLLLQMDGSHHQWNGKDWWCLIAMIDDATSDIPYAEFFSSEDTLNCMQVLESVIFMRGIPEAVYVDKAGWFGGTKRTEFSQFERACGELGTRVIFANSPEAKGRIERAWQTFQDRLIPELRLAGIKSMRESNEYLRQVFLPRYWNKRNKVIARDPRNSYRQLPAHCDLGQVFCLKEHRLVTNNRTLRWERQLYVVKGNLMWGINGSRVEIRRYRDGSWQAYKGGCPLELKLIDSPTPAEGGESKTGS